MSVKGLNLNLNKKGGIRVNLKEAKDHIKN